MIFVNLFFLFAPVMYQFPRYLSNNPTIIFYVYFKDMYVCWYLYLYMNQDYHHIYSHVPYRG